MTWRSVAIYARVSKRTGERTVEQQLEALRGWIRDRALKVVEFVELESTLKIRPIHDAMLLRARQGEFDALVCWKFDRFARSARELIMWLDECRGLGIDFLSFSEALDTSTPMGRAVFTILAAVAELERSMISERTRAKLEYLKAHGVKLGRPKIHVDVDRARALLKKGLSIRKLARALGVSRATAERTRAAILAA